MICINVNIPDELCEINDELKAIYHSHDSFAYGSLKHEMIEINLWMKLLEC